MHEIDLRPGDSVTVRRGASLLPEERRRLHTDCRGKVIGVTGRSVRVEVDAGFLEDEDGSRLVAKYLTFDHTYVYRRD